MRGGAEPADSAAWPPRRGGAGLLAVVLGYAAAVILAAVATGAFGALSGHPHRPSSFGSEVADLVGEWIGFCGAAVLATWSWRRAGATSGRGGLAAAVRADYGLALRWWDLPLGVAAGVGSQYLVAPAFEALLLPFVHDLYRRIGGPAHQLTSPAHTTAGAVVLALLLCVGSPLVEELYFRGLLLRSLAARLAPAGRRTGEVLAIVLSALVFALVHFEALQLLGLFGFGLVLALLARRTGRLGPGIIAHVSFNAVTVISIALAR